MLTQPRLQVSDTLRHVITGGIGKRGMVVGQIVEPRESGEGFAEGKDQGRRTIFIELSGRYGIIYFYSWLGANRMAIK